MNSVSDTANKVTTVEQARALPEVRSAYCDIKETVDPETGITTVERHPRKFSAHPIDGDQILLFVDADGRSMQVCYTDEGPAKTPFRW